MKKSLRRDALGLFAYFLLANPGRTLVMIALLFLSGLAEGVGFLSMLPVLELLGETETNPTGISARMESALAVVGLSYSVGTVLTLIVVSIALKASLLWLGMRQVGYTVAQVATDLRLRLLRGLVLASWGHFAKHPAGHYATALSSEAHRAAVAFRAGCQALAGAIRSLAYLAVAAMIAWQVAVAGMLLALAAVLILQRFVAMSRRAGRDQTQGMKALVARLEEALPGIKPIKAMGRERFLLPLLERETQEVNRAHRQEVLANESMRAFQEPILVAALSAGLYAVTINGGYPLSGILVLAVVFYRMVGTANHVHSHYLTMMIGESAFWSIIDQIEDAEAAQERSGDGPTVPALDEFLRFESVTLRRGALTVIDRISLEIKSGSFVAFLGPSGSGKTTLLDLITGLLPPSTGVVSVDGTSLGDVNMYRWRSQIGYVPQEMIMFRGSIFDNVTLGDPDIDRASVERALRDAGAWEFVSRYPEGMDRNVGERGLTLSGGQRQRIAIARALVTKPRLLVLDEATTALDPTTEAEICETLRQLTPAVTIVAVSHQRALQDAAQEVFEVADGQVTRLMGRSAPRGAAPSRGLTPSSLS